MESESDLRADKNVINTIFRSGFVFDPSDRRQRETVAFLKDMKLVRVREFDVIKCVNEDDDDYETLGFAQHSCDGEIALKRHVVALGYTFCPSCNREVKIEGKHHFSRSFIEVNVNHVLSYLLELLKSTCKTVTSLRSDVVPRAMGTYKCVLNDHRTILVAVVMKIAPDFVFTWPKLYKTPVCFVLLTTDEIASAYRQKYVFIPLSDLLISPKRVRVLNKCLLTCADYYAKLGKQTHDFDSINRMFEKFVNSVGDREFEAFTHNFLESITKKRKKVLAYQRLLQFDKSSLFGCLNRQMGRSGLQDIFSEPKIDYLHILFKSRRDFEVKRYNRTVVGLRELTELMRFCERRNTDGVLVTSSANVTGSVWNEILQNRNSHRYWKYIVIDRPLLLELLTEFDLLDLLKL